MKTMNKIKSFEEACNKQGYDATLPDVSGLPVKHQKAIIAHYKLVIITEALNDGHEHDWTNPDEHKYYPFFDMKESAKQAGSGLVYDGYDYNATHSHVGSRLCFKSAKLAKYAAKQFADLYADYFLMDNPEPVDTQTTLVEIARFCAMLNEDAPEYASIIGVIRKSKEVLSRNEGGKQ